MSDERIITATIVTPGKKDDDPQLEELVKQIRRNGMKVETVVGNKSIPVRVNIILSQNEEKGFELAAQLHSVISHSF